MVFPASLSVLSSFVINLTVGIMAASLLEDCNVPYVSETGLITTDHTVVQPKQANI